MLGGMRVSKGKLSCPFVLQTNERQSVTEPGRR